MTNFSVKAGVKPPSVYVPPGDDKNLNMQVRGEPQVMVVNRQYAESLTTSEKNAIVAHEVTHIAAGHIKHERVCEALGLIASSQASWHLGAAILSFNLSNVPEAILAVVAVGVARRAVRMSNYIQQEYQADRGSVLLTKCPVAMVSGLEKAMSSLKDSNSTPTKNNLKVAFIKAKMFISMKLQETRPGAIYRFAQKHNLII